MQNIHGVDNSNEPNIHDEYAIEDFIFDDEYTNKNDYWWLTEVFPEEIQTYKKALKKRAKDIDRIIFDLRTIITQEKLHRAGYPQDWILEYNVGVLESIISRLVTRKHHLSWQLKIVVKQDSYTNARLKLEQAKKIPINKILKLSIFRRSGSNYKTNCPLHDEKTPSFVVYVKQNSWHCFGQCSTGGDAIELVKRMQNCTFKQAVEFLNTL